MSEQLVYKHLIGLVGIRFSYFLSIYANSADVMSSEKDSCNQLSECPRADLLSFSVFFSVGPMNVSFPRIPPANNSIMIKQSAARQNSRAITAARLAGGNSRSTRFYAFANNYTSVSKGILISSSHLRLAIRDRRKPNNMMMNTTTHHESCPP